LFFSSQNPPQPVWCQGHIHVLDALPDQKALIFTAAQGLPQAIVLHG